MEVNRIRLSVSWLCQRRKRSLNARPQPPKSQFASVVKGLGEPAMYAVNQIAWLFLAYKGWLDTFEGRTPAGICKASLGEALILATLVMPIELMHHLIPGLLGLGLVALSSALLLIAVMLKVGYDTGREQRVRGRASMTTRTQ